MVSWRWVGKQAGAPLVRLAGRRGWLGIWTFVGTATAFYFAGYYLSRTSAMLTSWPFYVLGFGFGWAAANAVRYIYPRHIDLRAAASVSLANCSGRGKTYALFFGNAKVMEN